MGRTEIKPEFLSLAALNPWAGNCSSPRLVMDSSHASSRPSLLYPDEVLIKTGIEYELGKYINDVRTDKDCIVKAIIPKYKEYGVEEPAIYSLLVEYEEDDQIYIDIIHVDMYKSNHSFFGYKLKLTDEFNNLTYNSNLLKDTILATTDSYGKDGSYKYGLNCNVVFMSHPSVAEDGIVVSESFLERSKFTSINKRVINLTKDTIPLNLYGDDNNFKFIPNIGENVRPDGMLCAIRQRNDWFSVSDMNNNNLSEIDHTFDIPMYVPNNSIVIDINIIKGSGNKPEFSSKLTEQLDNYASMLTNYYQSVINKFETIMKEKSIMYGKQDIVKLTPRLHRFITDSTIKINSAVYGKNKLCYRKLPIDQYRIEITTMSVIKPNLGFKITGIFGDKGVICKVLPDSHMPVDELGNRADVITDNTSTISRMNLGRAYQLYLSAACRDNKLRLQTYYFNKHGKNYINKLDKSDIEYGKQYLRGFYSFINSDMINFIDNLNKEESKAHLTECLTDNIYLYYPPDNENNVTDIIEAIENSPYKAHIGKISYVDDLGKRVTSKDNIRVGQLYIMLLEKIANDYSAVSSSRVNNFSFPVKGTNIDKHKYPHSLTPTKTLGETEVRIFTSFSEPELVSDLIDLTLNPVSHKLLIKSILENEKVLDHTFNIDRTVVPYGHTKSLMILKHMFNAAGIDYEYVHQTASDI